jgi:hypothetical protein
MGQTLRLHGIDSRNNFSVSYKSGASPYPTGDDSTFGFVGTFTPSDKVILIPDVEFDTQYWVKVRDNVSGRYVIKGIHTHSSKAYPCYGTISFVAEVECKQLDCEFDVSATLTSGGCEFDVSATLTSGGCGFDVSATDVTVNCVFDVDVSVSEQELPNPKPSKNYQWTVTPQDPPMSNYSFSYVNKDGDEVLVTHPESQLLATDTENGTTNYGLCANSYQWWTRGHLNQIVDPYQMTVAYENC